MTIYSVKIEFDGYVNGATGQVTHTAQPWTMRVSFANVEGDFLVGFFDTLPHAAAAVVAAQTANQLGASASPASLTTWMKTTSPQAGFVQTRAKIDGVPLKEEFVR